MVRKRAAQKMSPSTKTAMQGHLKNYNNRQKKDFTNKK